jgi:hypothetical protein
MKIQEEEDHTMKIIEEEEDSMIQEIKTMVKVMVEAKEEEEINNTLGDLKINLKEVKTCLKSSAKDVFIGHVAEECRT